MARSVLLHLLRSQTRTYSTNIARSYHLERVHKWQGGFQGPVSLPKSASQVSGVLKRWCHESTLPEGDNNGNKDENYVVYSEEEQVFFRLMSLLSVLACCRSASLVPATAFMNYPKTAMASTALFLTAYYLNRLLSARVYKLRWKPGSDSFDVKTMTRLAIPTTKTLKFDDIVYVNICEGTVFFRANEKRYLFKYKDFPNRELLAKLTLQKSETHTKTS